MTTPDASARARVVSYEAVGSSTTSCEPKILDKYYVSDGPPFYPGAQPDSARPPYIINSLPTTLPATPNWMFPPNHHGTLSTHRTVTDLKNVEEALITSLTFPGFPGSDPGESGFSPPYFRFSLAVIFSKTIVSKVSAGARTENRAPGCDTSVL